MKSLNPSPAKTKLGDLVNKIRTSQLSNPSYFDDSLRLVSFVLNINFSQISLEHDRVLSLEELMEIEGFLARLNQGEPYAYIVGFVDFYHAVIKVNPNVLIPRYETEILVDKILAKKAHQKKMKVLDLCCGSGAIAIALKKERPSWEVYASDISDQALNLAGENAKNNHVDIDFRKGDLFEPFDKDEKFDLIVCNPPYISEQEYQSLERSVKDYEPKLALTPGVSGLEIYKRIAESIHLHLSRAGCLALEIGYNQKTPLLEIFFNKSSHITTEKDYAGLDRFIFLEYQ